MDRTVLRSASVSLCIPRQAVNPKTDKPKNLSSETPSPYVA